MKPTRRDIYKQLHEIDAPPKYTRKDIVYFFICLGISVNCIVTIRGMFTGPTMPASGKIEQETSPTPPVFTPAVIQAKTTKPDDIRVYKVRAYLKSKNSPMADYAQTIIDSADKYAIDWTRVVAISGMESAYGTKQPAGSHNAWGLGGSKFMRFESWDESIEYATKLLAKHYRLNELKGIKAKYCPESDNCNPKWAEIVADNSEQILASAY